MRRMFRITGWIGLTLSGLLFVATIALWLRSLGHGERWSYDRFEPRPDWTMRYRAGQGIEHRGYAAAIHGRLWLGSGTFAPEPQFKPRTFHRRDPILADEAKKDFDSRFQPGQRSWGGGTERAWRFAGAGFRHRRDPVDPRLGRPRYEGFILAIPFWMPAIGFGLWPGLFITRRLLRRKRFAQGFCQHCGYDLRATPDRCPECGRVTTAG